MMRNFDAGEWSLTDYEEKKYDAKKTASFSDDLTRDFQEYKDRANALEAGYGRYYNNDTYVGRNARDSKEFIGTRQTEEIHYENLDIQKEFLYAVAYIEDAFKEMVDPSPNAKIDSAVLEEIKHEQKAFAKVYDEDGYELECWARRMVDNFGRFGVSTRPSCAVIRDRYEELCGNGGHIDKCNKKLKEFDDFALNYLKKAGLKERSYKLQSLIKNTAGKLDLFSVYQPTMTNNSISLVALNSLPFKEFMARQMYSINTKIQNTEDVIGIKEFLDKNGIKVNKWISKKDGYFLIDKPISEILRDAGVDTETLDYKSYDDWYITGIPREDGTIAYSIIKIREPMDEQGAKAIAVPFNSLKISNLEKIISDAKAGNPIDEQALNGFRSDITKLSQADNYFNEYDEDILEYWEFKFQCV